ncbi:hypothetical protein [Synechococcus sp. PCC 7336]|uniref:hypothetical protein n=1 Tax=Synechococcus sp. PCC 7336 TaxID=195250 RepID=UPI000378F022|nr:hypothetical protein [Synechococcus sp. PCC 7336]
MELYRRIEQILAELRSVFSRQATFEWFVLLMWGILLSSQAPAITSYLNMLGVGEKYYHQALHLFHSSAWSVEALCQKWGNWLLGHDHVHRFPRWFRTLPHQHGYPTGASRALDFTFLANKSP